MQLISSSKVFHDTFMREYISNVPATSGFINMCLLDNLADSADCGGLLERHLLAIVTLPHLARYKMGLQPRVLNASADAGTDVVTNAGIDAVLMPIPMPVPKYIVVNFQF